MIFQNLNEAIVEDATLTWFGDLGYLQYMTCGEANEFAGAEVMETFA